MPCQIFSVSFELKDLIIETFYDTNAKGKYIIGKSQGLFIKSMRPNVLQLPEGRDFYHKT